ncbi:hypothetical protein N9924_01255 [bacterium]|nr:hypothetical protein [bacterium]
MTITRAITRSITRAITRAITGGIALIQRYFTSLNGTTGYYAITTPFTPAGDYEWEADFNFDGSLVRVFGNVAGSNSTVTINADGSINWRPENATSTGLTLAIGTVSATGLNNIRVKRSGATGEIFLNNVSVGSGAVPTGAALVDAFGNQGGLVNDGNILANTKNTDLGPQLFTTFTSTDPGSSYIAGVLTLVQNSGQDFATSDVSIVSGTSYTIDYNVTSENLDPGGQLRITTNSGNTTRVLLPYSVGPHSEVFIADANYLLTLRLGSTGGGQVVIGDSWSVRETDSIVTTTFNLDSAPGITTENSLELNNSVTMNGIAAADTELYTLINGEWVGADTWVPYTVIGLGWVHDGGRTYSRTSAQATATECSYTDIVYDAGDTIRITVDIKALTSGAFRVRSQGGADALLPQSIGIHSVDVIAGSSGTSRLRSNTAGTLGTAEIISVTKVIPVA